MPKQTLLDMTQEILSSMSSDEVNSIGDSTEAMQVATIIKRKFYDIVSRTSLGEQEQLIQLTASNDSALPVLMLVPEDVIGIKWIKYFNSNVLDGSSPSDQYQHDLNVDLEDTSDDVPAQPPGYCYVTLLPAEQFLDQVNSYNPGDSNVLSYLFEEDVNTFPSEQTLYFQNNCQPRFCTVISNKYILFDSFDSTQDTTLQAGKTMCMARVAPKFRLEDTYIPDLDERQFSLLVNEAKALAFFELKQQPHMKAEQEIKRQWSSLQKNKDTMKISDFDKLPSFGRHGATSTAWYGNNWRGNHSRSF